MTENDLKALVTVLADRDDEGALSDLISCLIKIAHEPALTIVDDTIIQAGFQVLKDRIDLATDIVHDSKDCIYDTATLHKYKDYCARLHSQLIQAIKMIESNNDYITRRVEYREQYYDK